MLITTKVCFDLQHQHHPATIDAVQNDRNSRGIVMALFSGGISWQIPDGVTAAIGYCKPDKTNGLYDTLPNGKAAVTLSNSTVTAVFAPQMLAAPGVVEAIIVLTDASLNQLGTFPFKVNVAANPAADAIKSQDYYNYSTMEEINEALDVWLTDVEARTSDLLTEVREEKDNFLKEASAALSSLHDAASACAPAIVCDAAGQVITVSDASKRLFQGLKVYGKTEQRTTTGKNLFDVSSIVAKGSYTAMDKTEDSIRIYSTDAAGTYHGIGSDSMILKAGTTYAVSFNMDAYVSGTVRVGFRRYKLGTFVSGASKTGMTATGAYSFTYTPSEDIEAYLSILVTWTTEGEMGDATFSEIQIEVGPEATGYEPYTGGMPSPSPDYPQELESVGDGGTVNTMIRRRNWIPYPYRSSDGYSANGLTFHVREDGSVVINGTATAETFFYFATASVPETLVYLPAGTYTFSGVSGGTFGGRLRPQLWVRNLYNDIRFSVYAEGKTFTITEPDHFAISIDIVEGNTLTDFVVKPMLNTGETALPYEPPAAPQTLSVATPNGLPGIPVTSGGNYTDENGQQWICDEVDFAQGKYVQRIGKLSFDGSDDETWEARTVYESPVSRWLIVLPGIAVPVSTVDKPNILCNRYNPVSASDTYNAKEGFSLQAWGTYSAILIYNQECAESDVTAWKAYLAEKPVTAYCVLNSPIETPIPEDELAAYAALHTNYPNTTILNDAGAYMEVEYIADTKMYVDNQFAQLAAALLNNT